MGAFLETLFWFLVVLTPIVFVHEFGHYFIARLNRVRVEVFSIGFGPELFGFYDRAGTRWKFSALPLGGYVKMLGQNDLGPDDAALGEMSEADRRASFHTKSLAQKAAIVAAGPLANLVLAIIIFASVFMIAGQPFTPARVVEVLPASAAERAGFQAGDLITSINGYSIHRFEEVVELVPLYPDQTIEVGIERDGQGLTLTATPQRDLRETPIGDNVGVGVLGVRGPDREIVRHNPLSALWEGWRQTRRLVSIFFLATGQMLSGDRGADEIGGPVRIAQMSDAAAQSGIFGLVFFAAYLSITLGVINLFPIPVLDGGHLAFYAYEAVRGRPPSERMQEYSLRIGLALLLCLMVFATYNDLARLPVVKYVVGLVS
jgi:regulator of sigma E protease